MKAVARNLIERAGLLPAAQRTKRALHARGWFRWEPLVPPDSFAEACDRAIAALAADGQPFGAYLEFGVSRGTSMACMYHALGRAGLHRTRLFGFDSFEGMPPEAAGQGWRPGQYASTRAATRAYLTEQGVDLGRVELVKGWFRDTLTDLTLRRLGIGSASVIMVDCDIYTATREALSFAGPLIGDRAVVILDDWGARADRGEIGQREAWQEFLQARPELEAEEMASYRPESRMFMVRRAEG